MDFICEIVSAASIRSRYLSPTIVLNSSRFWSMSCFKPWLNFSISSMELDVNTVSRSVLNIPVLVIFALFCQYFLFKVKLIHRISIRLFVTVYFFGHYYNTKRIYSCKIVSNGPRKLSNILAKAVLSVTPCMAMHQPAGKSFAPVNTNIDK